MASDQNATIRKSPVSVRQGSTRPKLVYVLGASLLLAVVVFAAVGLMTVH